jgi:hypothetical protein
MGLYQNMNNGLEDSSGRTVGGLNAGSAQGLLRVELAIELNSEDAIIFLQKVGAIYDMMVPARETVEIDLGSEGDTKWPTPPTLLLEHTIRVHGEQIRVHKSDQDEWPSDLHGHPLGRPREKIDVYTGDIYSIQNRKKVGRLGKKDLRRVHDSLREKDWAAQKLAARGL